MEGETVAAIIVKGLGVDEHGLQKYLWATKSQAEQLLEAQFDSNKRYALFMLGNDSIRPCDIVRVQFKKVREVKEWPAFRGYVLDELEKEQGRGRIGGGNTAINNKINDVTKGLVEKWKI